MHLLQFSLLNDTFIPFAPSLDPSMIHSAHLQIPQHPHQQLPPSRFLISCFRDLACENVLFELWIEIALALLHLDEWHRLAWRDLTALEAGS